MIVRGLESAAKGMVALMDMNDRIANNLATRVKLGHLPCGGAPNVSL